MWVERFEWWGQYDREIQFARRILEQPDVFFINPEQDIAILGNTCALWVHGRAVLYGYEPDVGEEAKLMLQCLPALADCTPEQALARARLSYGIGYQYRLGGLLTRAAAQYAEAKAAFRQLKDHQDELAIVLNTLAFTYAKQGRMALARPLAHDALRINEKTGNQYSVGLTLSTLAAIARIRGNYPQAITYGEEALTLFRELEDAHGTVLAYLSIASARRLMGKHDFVKGRKLEEAYQKMENARDSLERAIKIAETANLEADLPGLRAEQGRVYRDMGHLVMQLEGFDKGLICYRRSENYFNLALKSKGWAAVDRADTLEDLAEVLFTAGNPDATHKCLAEIEKMVGPDYFIIPGKQIPQKGLPTEYFAPLAKVEWWRGEMAFAQQQVEQGPQHYILAYAYFTYFSPDAMQKGTLIEYLYNHLHRLPVERQQTFLKSVRSWLQQYDTGVDISEFAGILKDLLGI